VRVTAVVMAGGEGRRLALNVEKPMVKVVGKPMVQWVLEALSASSKVSEVFVVVSAHTSKTKRFVKGMGFNVLEAPGLSYVEDLKYVVTELNLASTLTASADLPQLTSEVVNVVVNSYKLAGKPALTVVAPVEDYEGLGVKPRYKVNVKGVLATPIGVNVVNGHLVSLPTLEQEYLLLKLKPPLINVNTLNELKLAKNFMRQGLRVKLVKCA